MRLRSLSGVFLGLLVACWDAGAQFHLPTGDADTDEDPQTENDPTDNDGDPTDNDGDPTDSDDDPDLPTALIELPVTGATLGPLKLTVSGLAYDTDGISLVEVWLDAEPKIEAEYSAVSGAWSVTLAGPLEHGTHVAYLAVHDANDDVGENSVTFMVDAEPPTATAYNLPPADTNSTDLNVTVGGEGVVTYRYMIGWGEWSADRPVSTRIEETVSEGDHSLVILGIDAVGNVEQAGISYYWTVDTTAPSLLTVLPPAGGLLQVGETIDLWFSESFLNVEVAGGSLAEDVATLMPLTNGGFKVLTDGNWTTTGDGDLVLEFTDLAGNAGAPTTLTFYVADNIIYLAREGNDTTALGSKDLPFGTIIKAMQVARSVPGTAIAVQQGNFHVNFTAGDNIDVENFSIVASYSDDWASRLGPYVTTFWDDSNASVTASEPARVLTCKAPEGFLFDGLIMLGGTGWQGNIGPYPEYFSPVVAASGCRATLRNLYLNTGGWSSALLVQAGAAPTVVASSLQGSSGLAIKALPESKVTVLGSTLDGGYNGAAYTVQADEATLFLAGNVIVSPLLLNASTTTILNNTIGGAGVAGIAYNGGNLLIANNLFFNFDCAIKEEGNATLAIYNNGFDASKGVHCVGGNSWSVSKLEYADGWTGNITIDVTATVTDLDGADNSVTWLADNNWTVRSTAACNIRQGGRNTDLDGDDWNWTYDVAAQPRTDSLSCTPTNTNAGGWSMGAYEQDL